MSMRKALSWMAMLAVLGSGLAVAQEKRQTQARSAKTAKSQVRTMFMDQNGDGINDFRRDHDNDGIPNCQDKDWSRPEDGTGYKNRFARTDNGRNLRQSQGRGQGQEQRWNRASFRDGGQRGSFGGGVCDGTGPKGKTGRKSGR